MLLLMKAYSLDDTFKREIKVRWEFQSFTMMNLMRETFRILRNLLRWSFKTYHAHQNRWSCL